MQGVRTSRSVFLRPQRDMFEGRKIGPEPSKKGTSVTRSRRWRRTPISLRICRSPADGLAFAPRPPWLRAFTFFPCVVFMLLYGFLVDPTQHLPGSLFARLLFGGNIIHQVCRTGLTERTSHHGSAKARKSSKGRSLTKGTRKEKNAWWVFTWNY